MIINDNTEIASLLREPQSYIDIAAGHYFAKACQHFGNDVREGEVYATFKYHGCTKFYPATEYVDCVVVYTFTPRDAEPIFIPSTTILNLYDLFRYVSNTLHDFDRFTTWAIDDIWGKNNNRYEAICRALKAYWDMANIRTNIGVRLINTTYRQESTWFYSWCDSHFDTPINTRTIYPHTKSDTLFVEMKPDKRGEYQ